MTALVERFDTKTVVFNVGRNAIISFDAGEFATVMRLRCTGSDVVENRRGMTNSMMRIFNDLSIKPSSRTRPRIAVKLFKLVVDEDTSSRLWKI